MKGVSELGFNVPPTSRSYGDRPQFRVISESRKSRESGLRPLDWYSSASSTLHSDRKDTEKESGNNIKGRIGRDTANENQREIKVNP